MGEYRVPRVYIYMFLLNARAATVKPHSIPCQSLHLGKTSENKCLSVRRRLSGGLQWCLSPLRHVPNGPSSASNAVRPVQMPPVQPAWSSIDQVKDSATGLMYDA